MPKTDQTRKASEKPSSKTAPNKPKRVDPVIEAVDLAREGVAELAGEGSVGEHLGARLVDNRLAVHSFACEDAGYPGWRWEVSLARAPRAKHVTVCEVGLFPGEDALVAPEWVPWEARLRPEDVTREDVLPYDANDSRLISGFEQTDPEIADAVGVEEIGLGRVRVLSPSGIDLAARRWYDSDQGPVPGLKPGATCATCGFFLKMTGSLGQVFGVCANEWSPDDGKVVSMDHGCGAHSETDTTRRRPQWPVTPSKVDDFRIEVEQLQE